MDLLLTVEGDIEDRCRPVLTCQRMAQVAFCHAEHVSRFAGAVEHSRNETSGAETPRGTAPFPVSALQLEFDALTCHGRQV